MNVLDRFLHYVSFDTQSDEQAKTVPSTPGQRVLAEALAAELKTIGLDEVEIDANGYVMATLPATDPSPRPVIGFIAHMDTSPDSSGSNVKPRRVQYTGGDIVLNEAQGMTLSPTTFPELANYKGQELIVTDGTTLLGADDKAGMAAIVTAMEYLVNHPEIPHGRIRIGFTPDEEVGRGADHFDVARFGCEWAYTIDGGEIGELEYENFNAAAARIAIRGRSVHPGTAKDRMINALQVACELNAALPPYKRPEHTSGREGFFHLTQLSGTVERATMSYIIRDHDRTLFEAKKQLIETVVERLNSRYGNCIELELRDQYYNMYEVVSAHPHIVELAHRAMTDVGVTPKVKAIRGGTDGARLSFMGLPCPNLFAGGHNFHGPYEFLPVPSLEKSMQTIIRIVELVGNV